MTDTPRTPPDSIARMWNYGTGGKDHTAADRSVLDAVIALDPLLPKSMRAQREFVHRGAATVARLGVRQLLDLGSGLPAADGQNIYDTVQESQPEARVVYVDVAAGPAAHGRALLGKIPPTLMVQADVRHPARVLKEASGLLDPDEPVGIIATALVHFWPDRAEADRILRTYQRAFPAGGYLVFSHACADMDPDLREAMVKEYSRSGIWLYPRPAAEIASFLGGLVMLKPGLVEATSWRPEPDRPALAVGQAKFFVAVAGFGSYAEKCPDDERYTPEGAGI
jgi:S-adenosyl methyltransferase